MMMIFLSRSKNRRDFPGSWGCSPEKSAGPTRRALLHGSHLYGGLLPGNVRQMAGPRLCQVLYQRLVLVGFCHRDGKYFSIKLTNPDDIFVMLLIIYLFFLFKFSIMNLAANWLGVANIPVFKTMRTLRGLRPLRALSRLQSMKVSLSKKSLFSKLTLLFWVEGHEINFSSFFSYLRFSL